MDTHIYIYIYRWRSRSNWPSFNSLLSTIPLPISFSSGNGRLKKFQLRKEASLRVDPRKIKLSLSLSRSFCPLDRIRSVFCCRSIGPLLSRPQFVSTPIITVYLCKAGFVGMRKAIVNSTIRSRKCRTSLITNHFTSRRRKLRARTRRANFYARNSFLFLSSFINPPLLLPERYGIFLPYVLIRDLYYMDNGIYPVCFYFTSRLIPFTVSTSFTLFLEEMWRDSGISLRETKFEELEEVEDWDSEKLRWFIVFNRERIWNARVSDIGHEESIKTLENNPRWSREREREPDIDGRRGALRWCPVVLRLDYAAKIEILDSSETGREDEGLTDSTFIVSASALLPPPLYRR